MPFPGMELTVNSQAWTSNHHHLQVLKSYQYMFQDPEIHRLPVISQINVFIFLLAYIFCYLYFITFPSEPPK